MANYNLPNYIEKRPRYFDGQFLLDQDFIDEQKYHLDRQRRHNRLLHVSGIAEGLTVTLDTDLKVTVAPGTAVDKDGRQIVLSESQTVDLKPLAKEGSTVDVNLLIAYGEAEADVQQERGSADYTRWHEKPVITTVAEGEPYPEGSPPVLLARCAVTTQEVRLDPAGRDYSGLHLPGPGAEPLGLRASASVPGQIDLHGTLHVNKNFILDGSLGIGTTQPNGKLHIAALGDAVVIKPNTMGNGDVARIVFADPDGSTGPMSIEYKDDGNPDLALLGGNVGIGTPTPADQLDVRGAARLLTGSNPIRFTAGWSDFPAGATNQAEISNDTVNFKTLMIVGNRSAGLGRRVSVWDRLEVNGLLLVKGDVHLIAPNRGTGGRALVHDTNNVLALNYGGDFSGGVNVQSALKVSGDLEVTSKVNVTGNLASTGTKLTLAATQIGQLTGIYGALATWDNDSLFVGVKDEGADRKDSIIAFGDNPEESLRIFFARYDAEAKELMRVTSDGKIGIGTTAPKGRLHVASGDIVAGNDANGQKFVFHTRQDTQGDFLQITGDDSSGNWQWTKGITFVRASGNVGIGTTNPQAALQVSGGAMMPAVGNTETSGILFPKDPGGGSGDAAWMRYYVREGEKTTLEIGTGNDVDDLLVLKSSGGVEVSGSFKVSGSNNLIKAKTFIKAVKNGGENTAGSWSVDYTNEGFTEIYTVFAVMQGFSIYGNENDTEFKTWGHGESTNSIPQHAYVRVTSYNKKTASGVAYCSESRASSETDNTVLFTVVVLGRTG